MEPEVYADLYHQFSVSLRTYGGTARFLIAAAQTETIGIRRADLWVAQVTLNFRDSRCTITKAAQCPDTIHGRTYELTTLHF